MSSIESTLRSQGSWLRMAIGGLAIGIAVAGTLQVSHTRLDTLSPAPVSAFLNRVQGADEGSLSGSSGESTGGAATASEGDPSMRIEDLTVLEGHSSSLVEVKVKLDQPSSDEVRVSFSTIDGSAVAGEDYEHASGTAIFTPGETSTGVTVTVLGDDVEESDETFRIELSDADGAQITDTRAAVHLLNDDGSEAGRELPADSESPSDTEPPIILISTPLDAVSSTGWFNAGSSGTDGVFVQVTTSDPSGVSHLTCKNGSETVIGSGPEGSVTLGDGEHSISCVAIDEEGNTGAGEGSTVMPAEFLVDQTAPGLVCLPKPTFILRQPDATVSASVTDDTSGPSSETASGQAPTGAVGPNQLGQVTGSDVAGNQTTVDCPFGVIYRFTGFGAPLDQGGGQNSAEAGRAVPIKWRISDYFDVGVSSPSSFLALVSYSDTCGSDDSGAVNESAAGGSGLQYHGDGNWQFNWKTPRSYSGKCRTMRLDLDDRVGSRIAHFRFR